jgi:hypothetical protein
MKFQLSGSIQRAEHTCKPKRGCYSPKFQLGCRFPSSLCQYFSIDNDLRHCEKLLLLHFPRDDLYGSWSAVVHLSIIYLQSIFVTKYTEARERTRFHVQSIYIGERHEISRHDIDFLVGERDWNDNCCII